jgi:acyl-CoA synthetase (AMP-forming)/AMP-acid ligase II
VLDLIPRSARIIDLRTGEALDHDGLATAVSSRATALRAAGLAPGGMAAMCHKAGIVLLVDLLAAWQLGAAALVLSPTITLPERLRIIDWAKPDCWIGDDNVGRVPCLPPQLADPGAASGVPSEIATDGHDPALVLLTSGTTGRPKGVVLSHQALRTRLTANVSQIGRPDLIRSLALLPLHFGHGLIGNSLTPLFAGATLLLWTDPGVEGLAGLGAVIDEHAVTFLSSVPSLWRVALRVAARPSRGSLRRVHIGSEPLPLDLWQAVSGWAGTRRVLNMYGMTEAANWISGASLEEAGVAEGAVGRPWSGTWRVMPDDGSLAGQGRGELMLRDPGLLSGYFNDPEATAAAFHDGWFRTGDIGEIDGTGALRIVGRAKHQINRGGIKISAEEIDLLLQQHPDVEEACAFSAADPVSGETVAAAIVRRAGASVSPADLRAWCAARLRREAVPTRIVVVDALPRSDRGKIRRDQVARLALMQGGPAG